MLTELPKIAEITLFLGLCIPSLIFRCGDIEKNPGPKYSSLTLCQWNLNGLAAHDLSKSRYFKHMQPNITMTQYAYQKLF